MKNTVFPQSMSVRKCYNLKAGVLTKWQSQHPFQFQATQLYFQFLAGLQD